MFAYCGNNPVRRCDICGFGWLEDAWVWIQKKAEEVKNDAEKIIEDTCNEIVDTKNGLVAAVKEVYNYITNDDPEVCKKSTFSMYKCIPVFNIQLQLLEELKISSFSFGVIFMINENHITDYQTTLNHERGHSVQLMILGPARFLTKIAVPSITYNIYDRSLPREPYYYSLYYSWIWERGADFLGDVHGRTYLFDESGMLSLLYLLLP